MTAENDFSEGMALGLTMCGRTRMPEGSKPMVGLAFAQAWREWPHRSHFRFVGADRREREWYQIMHAGPRSHTWNFYWDRGAICPRQPDPDLRPMPDEVAVHIHPAIPAGAWQDLVETWLAKLAT